MCVLDCAEKTNLNVNFDHSSQGEAQEFLCTAGVMNPVMRIHEYFTNIRLSCIFIYILFVVTSVRGFNLVKGFF